MYTNVSKYQPTNARPNLLTEMCFSYIDITRFSLKLWIVCNQCICEEYRKTSNVSRTLVGNKIVDNSDVVGASPVGAAPTTSSFST